MGTEAGSGEEGGMSHRQELRHSEPSLQAAAHSVSSQSPSPIAVPLWSLLPALYQAQAHPEDFASQAVLAYREALGLARSTIPKINRRCSREALAICFCSLRKKKKSAGMKGCLNGLVRFGGVK